MKKLIINSIVSSLFFFWVWFFILKWFATLSTVTSGTPLTAWNWNNMISNFFWGSWSWGIFYNGKVWIWTSNPGTQLDIKSSWVSTTLRIDKPTAWRWQLIYSTNGSTRWNIFNVSWSESWGNEWSNFAIMSYNDSGNGLIVPFFIKRSSWNIWIWTTAPSYKLDIIWQMNSSWWLCIAGDCKTAWSQVWGSWNPTWTIIYVATESCPTWYIFTNWGLISRTTYSTLFSAIGTMYWAWDWSTTFALPDLRWYFIRWRDNAAWNDPDRASRTNRWDWVTWDRVGTKQTDAYKSHSHNYYYATVNIWDWGYSRGPGRNENPSPTDASWWNETRPKNINLLPCIKY